MKLFIGIYNLCSCERVFSSKNKSDGRAATRALHLSFLTEWISKPREIDSAGCELLLKIGKDQRVSRDL